MRSSLPAALPAPSRGSGLLLGFLVLAVWGCSWMGSGPDPSATSAYERGVQRLALGDFDAATQAFREAAALCESGPEGRRAILFLALVALDSRNPENDPDSGALMAASFLQLPNVPLEEVLTAEQLYVAALERGADPDLRPDPETSGLALRFDRCDEPVPIWAARALPEVQRPPFEVIQGLEAERRTLQAENEALLQRMEELEAELERIRALLRRPDTAAVRYRPGS